MARARGANAIMAGAFASSYGTIPGSGYRQLPFASANLGEEQGLINSDLLGYGRDPQQPGRDVINNDGDVVVPVDLRNFGWWLKLLLGAPVSTAGVAAGGSIVFSAQPTASSTITINGTAFTFVASGPTGNQIKIGASLAETVANAVYALNASAVGAVSAATYAADLSGAAILVTHDTIGTAGNTFTLVAGSSPASNGTASGATLAGGAASGPTNHVFTAGGLVLPDAAIEIGMPDVPSYGMNFGCMANTLAIPLQRSGLLNATVGVIAQGENRATTSATGAAVQWAIERFSQFTGLIKRDGVPLGNVVSGRLNLSNNLDKAEVIRPDGRIGGADPGMLAVTGEAVVRFSDTQLMDLATAGTPIEFIYGWSIGAGKSLQATIHNVYLPRPKLPITGPNGIQATFGWQGSEHQVLGKTATFTLVNDVTAY